MSGPQRGITEPHPTAIEERRRLRKAKQRRFVIWVSGASIVILVAAIGTVGTLIVSTRQPQPVVSSKPGDTQMWS